MFEVLGLGVVLLGLMMVGLLLAKVAIVLWILTLPFRLVGWVFQLAAAMFALPFLLLFGFLGIVIFGAGMLLFLVPALPFVLVVLFVVWLLRRGRGDLSRA